MAGEWVSSTLGDVLTLQRGFDLPESDREVGNYPVIASTGQVGTHSEPMVRAPGVVIGRSGSLGGGQFVTNDFWPLNTTLWVKDFKGNDVRFCYYLLKSLDLGTYNVGSGVPTLNRNHIHPLPVYLPPLPEQRAIAHILGALDDKIELNRRMNETLEAMARAMFQSWFVNFDPVRAKAEGRDTGLPTHIADLFSDSFEDSELGEIPKGWKVGTLGEVVGINVRSITKDYPYRVIQYVDISSVNEGTLSDPTEYDLKEAPSRAKRLVQNGDTIWSTVRPNRKSYLYINDPVENLVVSTGFVVLTPRLIPPTYLYAWVTTDTFVDYLAYNADGSAYPAVLPGRFASASILVAPDAVLDAFEDIVGTSRVRVACACEESRTLAALRDALLPRLISGELRVKDAERLTKETVS